MAITANKLLGKSEKGGELTARPKSNLVPFKGKGSDITKIEKKEESPLLVIKTKVIKIEDILKGTLAAEKRAADEKRKAQEQEERAENEEEVENPDKKNKGKKSGIKIPLPGKVKGWWNNIKKFFFTVLFGWLALRVMKWLPKLKGILKFLASFADFVLKWGGKILAGLVTFVDWGYKAYDWTRDKIEGVFGEKGAKAFDSISGVLNKTMNLIFGLGLAMIALSNEWGNQGGDGTNRRFKGVDYDTKIKNRRVRFNNPDYLKKLKARYKQRFGKNIRANQIPDPVQVNQPRRANFVDNIKNRFKGSNPLGDFVETAKVRSSKGLNIFTGKPAKLGLSDQIANWGKKTWKGTKRIAKEGSEFVVEGTKSNLKKSRAWLGDVTDSVYRNTIGKIDDWMKNLEPLEVIKRLAKEDSIVGRGTKGLIGMLDSPLARKIFGAAPFIGDAVIFLMDLLSGKHWVRALLRTIGALGVDAGFYGLLALTGIAAPFSAGTSLTLSAALIAAYMAADMAAGAALGNDGLGQFLGDWVADELGVPKKAGEEGGGKWANLFGKGSTNSMNNVEKLIEGVKLTEKQELAISKIGGGLGNTIKGDLSAISFDGKTYPRGLSGPNETFGGKGGSTYNNIVSTISVNDDESDVVVVRKSSSKLNTNETVREGQVIAVNTGGGSNGISQTNASLYRGN